MPPSVYAPQEPYSIQRPSLFPAELRMMSAGTEDPNFSFRLSTEPWQSRST